MSPCRVFLAILLMASMARPAWADTSYVEIERRLDANQLHATGLDTLTPAQLQLLNQLLREQSRAAIEADHSLEPKPHPARSLIGLEEGPITSRLMGRVDGWEPGTVFVLENGQQWKVLKGSATLRKPIESPVVKVVPGVAGRWFLQVDEDMPKARVYRVD